MAGLLAVEAALPPRAVLALRLGFGFGVMAGALPAGAVVEAGAAAAVGAWCATAATGSTARLVASTSEEKERDMAAPLATVRRRASSEVCTTRWADGPRLYSKGGVSPATGPSSCDTS
jgi:hypothetical protein